MLPGVSTRALVVKEPMPPTIVPYTGPPLASAPWQATHLAAYTCRPSATEPRPGGRPWPSLVRTSMFHAARSASLTGCPKRGLSGSARTGCGPVAPSGIPSAVLPPGALPPPIWAQAVSTTTAIRLNLADRIAHLPIGTDGPGLDHVVVLHEADDGARFAQIRHARLHIAVAVDRAAHQRRRRAIPVPRRLEAREALVHDRLFEHRLAPGLAAVDRDVDRADLAGAGPGEPADLMEPWPLELLPARGRGDDGLGFHHHAELAPLAVGHRIGVARRLAAEVPRLVGELDAPQPLHADVAFPARDHDAHRVAVLRTQRLAVHGVDDQRVVEHFLERDRARVRGSVGAFEQHPFAFRVYASLVQE